MNHFVLRMCLGFLIFSRFDSLNCLLLFSLHLQRIIPHCTNPLFRQTWDEIGFHVHFDTNTQLFEEFLDQVSQVPSLKNPCTSGGLIVFEDLGYG